MIIFVIIFSKIIFHNEIYLHHKISLGLSFLAFILLSIPIFSEIDLDQLLIHLIQLGNNIGYSLYIVLVKYITNKYYISPYGCLFFIGIINFIFIIIIIIIYSAIKEN